MSHMPECPVPDMQAARGALHPDDAEANCICKQLRACEQRVLNAAREAVAALEPLLDRSKGEGGYDCCGCATIGYLWDDALAAIDALQGDP